MLNTNGFNSVHDISGFEIMSNPKLPCQITKIFSSSQVEEVLKTLPFWKKGYFNKILFIAGIICPISIFLAIIDLSISLIVLITPSFLVFGSFLYIGFFTAKEIWNSHSLISGYISYISIVLLFILAYFTFIYAILIDVEIYLKTIIPIISVFLVLLFGYCVDIMRIIINNITSPNEFV